MASFTLKSLLVIFIVAVIFLVSIPMPIKVSAQGEPEINWIDGPITVDLGDQAHIELGDEYIFVDGENSRKILEFLGEPICELEVGAVFAKAEDEEWAIWFDYDPIGYVKDDEKESLDSKEILENIKEATDEQNKIRIKQGFPPIEVVGWYEKPHYDEDTNNLVWCVQGECEGIPLVNYQTRLLGRHGYMAVTLATDLATLANAQARLEDIINHFSWKSGKSYAEWVEGDKVAEIGLTALAAGAAGAIAAKTGLLSKIWKFLVAGIMAIVAAITGFIKRLRGKHKASTSGDAVG